MGSLKFIHKSLYIGLLFLFSCYKKPEVKLTPVTVLKEDFQDPSKQIGSVVADKTNSSNKLSRISKDATYGNGFIFSLPDSLVNKTLRFVFRAKVRSCSKNTFGHGFVTSLNKGDSQTHWSNIEIDPFIKKSDDWNLLVDSTQIPAYRNQVTGCEVRIYGYNGSKFDYVEYDDLTVEITIVN